MQLEAFLWLFLPVFVAGGSALLSFFIMQARMEVALAKERESLAEARATISSHKITMEERIKATEEATRRATIDEMMQDFRVEERSYMRESSVGAASKKLMVMQERMFFRNIPLSGWSEHEMLIEEDQPEPAAIAQSSRPDSRVEANQPAARLESDRPSNGVLAASTRQSHAQDSAEPGAAVDRSLMLATDLAALGQKLLAENAQQHGRDRAPEAEPESEAVEMDVEMDVDVEGEVEATRALVPMHAAFGAQ